MKEVLLWLKMKKQLLIRIRTSLCCRILNKAQIDFEKALQEQFDQQKDQPEIKPALYNEKIFGVKAREFVQELSGKNLLQGCSLPVK